MSQGDADDETEPGTDRTSGAGGIQGPPVPPSGRAGGSSQSWSPPRPQARVTLRPAPVTARDARRFVATTLTEWHLEDLSDVAMLLASELVTNAILHARSVLEVVVTRHADGVRVEVADASPLIPVVRAAPDLEMSGRGLALVESLAARWGVDVRPAGKSVWFELDAL
jgi:anti-sigma regulatory factor (Ser/Thr protein kinase)